MSIEQALNVSKNESFRLSNMRTSEIDPEFKVYFLQKDNKSDFFDIMIITNSHNNIDSIKFNKTVFNPDKKFVIDDNFINKFIEHYNIKFSESNIIYENSYITGYR